MATIIIDNQSYEVSPGHNLLEACLSAGLDLPYFCWHPSLGSVGSCRQCAIKVFKDENDTKGRVVMACMEPVREALRMSVQDAEATEFREHVIEWLMTNHPHDCAVCDEGGSCHLQDMTVMTGHTYRNYRFTKRTYRNQYLGPFLNHEMNRCIQCYRCVRFYKDYAGGKDLDVFGAHNHVYFGREKDGPLESEFSGNLAEVCPTGVFTDKTLKLHYTRKWDLTMAPSICQHCSLGCNTIAGERYGSLRQITSRFNGSVNGYFLCDRGRFGYEFVNSEERIRRPYVQGHAQVTVSEEEVVQVVREKLKDAKVIGIGSPRASVEANFALKTLVGKQNFYHGVSDSDHQLVELSLKLLRERCVHIPSLKEVESYDAVFVLGEDLTNTAPMLALAVRQAVRQQPLAKVTSIPHWQDAAVREAIQDDKGPLFIATFDATKLDDVATATYHASPDAIARLGFAVANHIDAIAPTVSDLTESEAALTGQIAQALLSANKPLIISGCSSGSESILRAASNLSQALCARKKAAGLVLTFPESNNVGLALLGGQKLDSAFAAVVNGYADTVIILENDLYRREEANVVDKFFKHCKQVILVDHIAHATAEKADVLLPAGTFAESDGTLVNNEGRAQRFYQVFQPPQPIRESWRWLAQLDPDQAVLSTWKTWDDVSRAIGESVPALQGLETLAPAADFRLAGQKIPRAPHRYSGRTAMNANDSVSEPKPPEDTDSPLSFTMEGYRGQAPSAVIPFFWSPGWNSVQSITKYQDQVGGHLRQGDPGLRLLTPTSGSTTYFIDVPDRFKPTDQHFMVVALHHIFGSDELSMYSPGLAQRAPAPYVCLNAVDAEQLQLEAGQTLEFTMGEQAYQLPVKMSQTLPRGIAGLPAGLPGLPYADLPGWATLKTTLRWKAQPHISY